MFFLPFSLRINYLLTVVHRKCTERVLRALEMQLTPKRSEDITDEILSKFYQLRYLLVVYDAVNSNLEQVQHALFDSLVRFRLFFHDLVTDSPHPVHVFRLGRCCKGLSLHNYNLFCPQAPVMSLG